MWFKWGRERQHVAFVQWKHCKAVICKNMEEMGDELTGSRSLPVLIFVTRSVELLLPEIQLTRKMDLGKADCKHVRWT